MRSKRKYLVLLAILFTISLSLVFIPVPAAADDTEQQVKEKLEVILQSEEFQDQQSTGFLDSLADKIEDIIEYIKEKLNRKKPAVKEEKPSFTGGKLPAVDTLVSGGIIVGILLLIGVLLHKEFYKSRQITQTGNLLVEMQNKPDEVQQRIQELYDQHQYRDAFRYMYLALLIDLNKMGWIRIDKSKTNRQYMRELKSSGYRGFDMVKGFTEAFNEYWYGKRELSRETFEEWQRKYQSLPKEEVL